jgi:hypothetical protein
MNRNNNRIYLPTTLWQLESLIIYFIQRLVFQRIRKENFDWYKISSPSSRRIYIFGSGWSLNEITIERWRKIRDSGATMGFNEFRFSRFLTIDYYIVREFGAMQLRYVPRILKERLQTVFNFKELREFTESLDQNSMMKNTKYIVLNDKKGGMPLLWYWFYAKSRRIVGFYSNLLDRNVNFPPSETSRNIPHGAATLFDAINLAYLLGYRDIVLVGVDLYDRRYFYQDKNETRAFDQRLGFKYSDTHNTANAALSIIEHWNNFIEKKGGTLTIFNERSLLSKKLRVFCDF